MQKGFFIVLEGPDGSGTTTHTTILADRLANAGKTVLLTHEPTDGPIGKSIRGFLAGSDIPSDSLQILFTADRAWHVHKEINPAIAEGKIVVCEQYSLSTVRYGEAAGLDERWLELMNERFPKPDMEIILLPPFDVCHARWSERETQEILEEEQYQRTVYAGYERYAKENSVPCFDSSREKDEVAAEIFDLVWSRLKS